MYNEEDFLAALKEQLLCISKGGIGVGSLSALAIRFVNVNEKVAIEFYIRESYVASYWQESLKLAAEKFRNMCEDNSFNFISDPYTTRNVHNIRDCIGFNILTITSVEEALALFKIYGTL